MQAFHTISHGKSLINEIKNKQSKMPKLICPTVSVINMKVR